MTEQFPLDDLHHRAIFSENWPPEYNEKFQSLRTITTTTSQHTDGGHHKAKESAMEVPKSTAWSASPHFDSNSKETFPASEFFAESRDDAASPHERSSGTIMKGQVSEDYRRESTWSQRAARTSMSADTRRTKNLYSNHPPIQMTSFPVAVSPMSSTSLPAEAPSNFLRARLQALHQKKLRQYDGRLPNMSQPKLNFETTGSDEHSTVHDEPNSQSELPTKSRKLSRQTSLQSLETLSKNINQTTESNKTNYRMLGNKSRSHQADTSNNRRPERCAETNVVFSLKSDDKSSRGPSHSPINCSESDKSLAAVDEANCDARIANHSRMIESKCTTELNMRPRWAAEPSAKCKLGELQNKIVKFEAQLQAESQQRRAAEERRLQLLGEGVCGLEKTLQAEVRRRLEANKAIQVGFETQLATLEAHIERTLTEKNGEVAAAVAALSARVQEAGKQVAAAEQADIRATEKLRSEVEKVMQDLVTVREQIEGELKARKQRESAMFDKVSDMQRQIESRIELEREMRHKEVDKLKSSLEAINKNHVALDESFEQQLTSAFRELRNALELETEAREQSDSDIVQALNQYTVALQGALRIANAT